MPKSKRDKAISLTRTKKKQKTLRDKQSIVNDIRECVDKYSRIFVVSTRNMRNNKIKDVRHEWTHSRFFFGNNRIMALALGRTKEDEYKDNLLPLSEKLKGFCGLLFTNKSKEEVLKWFESYSDEDFARSGNSASETVLLDKGPLDLHFAMEPMLRQLGLPTSLQKGVIMLIKDHKVCGEGDELTPEQARVLKLLGKKLVEFRITIECMWSNDGSFEEFKSCEPKDKLEENDSDEECPMLEMSNDEDEEN